MNNAKHDANDNANNASVMSAKERKALYGRMSRTAGEMRELLERYSATQPKAAPAKAAPKAVKAAPPTPPTPPTATVEHYRSRDVALGLIALTKVSGEITEVQVTGETKDSRGRRRFVVARTDNGKALPKARSARALRPVPGLAMKAPAPAKKSGEAPADKPAHLRRCVDAALDGERVTYTLDCGHTVSRPMKGRRVKQHCLCGECRKAEQASSADKAAA